jgi:DNA-directed RNA polymerase specialized sigma24 family protein
MDIGKIVHEFTVEFMKKHNSLINAIARKYLIPNRYQVEDIRQYISERIIQILTNRLSDEKNKIENPEKYFKSCLNFYCIEYQRMHGYIFDLPKRPRKNCEKDEEYIRSFGFKYLGDVTNEEYNSLTSEDNKVPYTDSVSWKYLLKILTKEEADVIDCIFNKNLTWQETSKYLNVPQSTCWIRKDRALEKIFRAFEKVKTNSIYDTIRKFLRGDSSILSIITEE